jgi:ABC-2 type transport system ATP-binding protein
MMIQVENLTKLFGPVVAVDNVSFEIDKGQVVGYLGLNGAGKTTSMRILTTYLPATSGVARIAGYDVMKQSMEVRRNIGYLPDSVPLYPEMRVEEYLDFRAKLKGVDRKRRASRLEFCLDRCRIREVRRRLMGTLSKGYRQRVGLADAMIHDPDVLILDEPTAGLDIRQQEETLRLIRELGATHTILFSTHRMTEVEAICDQVIIIAQGRLRLHRRMKDLDADAPTVLMARGPEEKILGLLRGIDGVARASVTSGHAPLHVYQVLTKKGQDLREAMVQRLVQNGHGVLSIERRASLRDFFEDLMGEGDAPPMPPLTPTSTEAIQGGVS